MSSLLPNFFESAGSPVPMTELDLPSHATAAAAPSILAQIVSPGINLAIFERPPSQTCLSSVEALMQSRVPIRIDFKNPSTADLVTAIAAAIASGIPRSSVRALASDISHLASLFSATAGTLHPRVRLERVDDDGCALFHADSLNLRLLCTYAGPGTEWLENSNTRRHELGLRSRTLDEANADIVVDPSRIRRLAPWHVAIFSGRSRPGAEDNALIHRSAPVLSANTPRLRLCIDLPADCGC